MNKDILFCIAQKLDLPDLLNFCECKFKNFSEKSIWLYKLNKEFTNYSLSMINENDPKETYLYLSKLSKERY